MSGTQRAHRVQARLLQAAPAAWREAGAATTAACKEGAPPTSQPSTCERQVRVVATARQDQVLAREPTSAAAGKSTAAAVGARACAHRTRVQLPPVAIGAGKLLRQRAAREATRACLRLAIQLQRPLPKSTQSGAAAAASCRPEQTRCDAPPPRRRRRVRRRPGTCGGLELPPGLACGGAGPLLGRGATQIGAQAPTQSARVPSLQPPPSFRLERWMPKLDRRQPHPTPRACRLVAPPAVRGSRLALSPSVPPPRLKDHRLHPSATRRLPRLRHTAWPLSVPGGGNRGCVAGVDSEPPLACVLRPSMREPPAPWGVSAAAKAAR
eukprot:scaffold27367_cov112-Isochrysis_galbana.AAC.14